jgi:hypothetical protein
MLTLYSVLLSFIILCFCHAYDVHPLKPNHGSIVLFVCMVMYYYVVAECSVCMASLFCFVLLLDLCR